MDPYNDFQKLLDSFNLSEVKYLKQQEESLQEIQIKKGAGFKKFRKCNNSKRPKPRRKK